MDIGLEVPAHGIGPDVDVAAVFSFRDVGIDDTLCMFSFISSCSAAAAAFIRCNDAGLRVARIVVSVLVSGEGARAGVGGRERSREAGGVGDLDSFAATDWLRDFSIARVRAVSPSLILSVMRSSKSASRMLATLM